jgi:predicted Zn-dependent protease
MALPDYSPCPCGSGKKFKWCCQPIGNQIARALQQDESGQHEFALRLMDELVAQHPDNPEVWGKKALILFRNNRAEDAEAALQKALEINPNYPFGYLLRGLVRLEEGEVAGALLLLRKAAALFDPEVQGPLLQTYNYITDCEFRLNHPVAARAALKMCLRLQPNDPELQKALDTIFGKESRFPAAACQEYQFLSPPANAPSGRRSDWDRALATAEAKLSDAVRVFEQLTTEDPQDAAAWYNLGLARAWLGDNAPAVEALDRYVTLEADERRAAAAWNLAEVLRSGHGMEEQADYLEHSVIFPIRDPQAILRLLEQFGQEGQLLGVDVRQEEGVITALVLERVQALTADPATAPPPRLGASLLLVGQMLRLTNVNDAALFRVSQEFQQRAQQALLEPRRTRGPAHFTEIFAEALVYPVHEKDQAGAARKINEHLERFYEETWIRRRLRSLDQIPPLDAAGHPVLRKKLLGVIQFLQDCAAVIHLGYDFDRLRRKLGLLGAAPSTPAATGAAEISAMSAAELSALPADTLAVEQLDEAYRTALKLDARDLANHFAQVLVARPPQPERPDRYPWYAHLVSSALAEGNTDAALNYLNEGEKADCEQNEGRRRNDYELQRGKVHAKRGEADAAQDVFERLIARVPTELKYRGSAAEAMLGLKQGARALRFAEDGLTEARKQNNRDSEGYFMELVAAAKKQGG